MYAGDSAAQAVEQGGAQRYVQTLAVLPGVEHIAVVDVAGERVLAEWGGPPGSARALLDRAHRAADRSRHGRRELEDVVSTTGTAFHLSRLVLAGPGHPESVWVAVRINRARGSLTWSRAALAGLDGRAKTSPTHPAVPAVDGAGGGHPEAAHDAPHATDGRGPAPTARAPLVVPPPPASGPAIPSGSQSPAPAPAAPEAPASEGGANGRVTLTAASPPAWKATRAPKAPAVAPTVTAAPGTGTLATSATAATTSGTADREPGTTDSRTGEPGLAETATVDTATTVELMVPDLRVPAARTSPENRPEPSLPHLDQYSGSFAPVITVPPPPSPVPDDGSSEEPAPMPAPIVTAPPLPSDGHLSEGEPATGPGSPGSNEAGPLDAARPETPGVVLVPRPPSPPTPAPTPPAVPGTVATGSADEPSVLRRLIHGLRRPS